MGKGGILKKDDNIEKNGVQVEPLICNL